MAGAPNTTPAGRDRPLSEAEVNASVLDALDTWAGPDEALTPEGAEARDNAFAAYKELGII